MTAEQKMEAIINFVRLLEQEDGICIKSLRPEWVQLMGPMQIHPGQSTLVGADWETWRRAS